MFRAGIDRDEEFCRLLAVGWPAPLYRAHVVEEFADLGP